MPQPYKRCSRPRLGIMDLPYKIHHELSHILDPGGAKGWKHLVSQMPQYTAKDVKLLETEGSKPGCSCTMQLLEDMDKRGYGVDELKDILKSSGNKKALECLLAGLDEDDSLMHEDTTIARNRKGRIRSSPSLGESSDLHMTKRHKRYSEEAKYSQSQISGTRETLGMDSVINQQTEESALYDSDPGTRETLIREDRDQCNPHLETIETLGMDSVINQQTEESALYDSDPGTRETLINSSIKQPTGKIGLRNRDSGTKGMARMEQPTAQPKDSTSLHRTAPGTRETLSRDSLNHQPIGGTGAGHPDPGTRFRETQSMDHPVHLPYPVQETNDLKQGVHSSCHFETLPPENDKRQNQDVDSEATTAPVNYLITRGQKVPIEQGEYQQESATRGIPTLSSLVKWVISCGSQGDAM